MNSHIQMPKCILKQFALDNNGFYKYDIQKGRINRGFPKSTFTEPDYYSETIEKAFNLLVENPLKKVLDYAKGFEEETLPEIMSTETREIAIMYLKSLIARSPLLLSSVKENSVFLQFASKQAQHDITATYAMQEEKMEALFNKFDFSFMINETNTPFVLPTRGLYEYQINGVLCINAPINPKCCIMLKEKGKVIHPNNKEKNLITILPKTFDDIVMKVNSFAMQRQKQDNIGYVVCHIKSVLEQLI